MRHLQAFILLFGAVPLAIVGGNSARNRGLTDISVPGTASVSPVTGRTRGHPGPSAKAQTGTSNGAVTLPAGATSDWWSTVQKQIRESEYHVTWQNKTCLPNLGSAYQAPNRAHNLRTYFTPEGIRVVPRTGEAAWEWGLTLAGYGRAGTLQEPAAAEPAVSGNRTEYRRGELTEWYVNDDRGLEQGFTLQSPPLDNLLGMGVQIDLRIAGNLHAGQCTDGRQIEFVTRGGVRVLNYGQLEATDAAGRELPAVLALAGERISILVDDNNAVYPVTIDPLTTRPPWTTEGNQADAALGYSVSTAGDVNGDGYSDVIVGAPYYNNGESDEGRAFVYHGSSSGLSANPAWTAESNQENAYFGTSVSTAGDVNGDGYGDVIVGAPFYSNGQTNEGRVFVYHGSAAGLNPVPDWTAESNQGSATFGNCVSTAGDVNGDWYSDIIIGAPNYDDTQNEEGAAFVYCGSAEGLAQDPLHHRPVGNPDNADWMGKGNRAGAQFGYSVSTAGDVNGDRLSDLMVGSPNYSSDQFSLEGRVYVFYGKPLPDKLNETPDWIAEGRQEGAELGWSVSTAGDVNGDGLSDIIAGAVHYNGSETTIDDGGAFVWYGRPGGLGESGTPLNANWAVSGDQGGSAFGFCVSTAGDLNRDGFSDVVVGAHWYTAELSMEGRVYVYHGSAAGLRTTLAWTAEGHHDGGLYGASVATAGDVNGDGYEDLVVGEPLYDNGAEESNEGRAYVYYGSATGLGAYSWTAKGDQTGAGLGFSVSTAGDVNADGYSDVIVGAPTYDDGQYDEGAAFVYLGSAAGLAQTPAWTAEGNQDNAGFGYCVSTAGDVNGDEYGDIIVGVPTHKNLLFDEGRAYVYYGGWGGVDQQPAWIADGNQESAYFGRSVSTAGDVNGDSYGDVIIGAYSYDNDQIDEGRAFVWYGSPTGLGPNGTPGNAPWVQEGNQEGAKFGFSVSTAGDVNGDGYGDIIVGAHTYDIAGLINAGRACVYLGSSAGLSATPVWTGDGTQAGAGVGYSVSTAGDCNGDGYSDVIIGVPTFDDSGAENAGGAVVFFGDATGLSSTLYQAVSDPQAGAGFGYSVAAAGDMNGDGYSDVVIGAPTWHDGQSEEGRVYVYYGSADGLRQSPAWTTESDQAYAGLGYCVAAAGDVNGDGFSDIIAGAPTYNGGQWREGQAFVYYGSADKLSSTPAWTVESDQVDAYFGTSVSTAGDMNGDGYSDVIIGAAWYDNGEPNEGAVFVYHGSATGLSATPAWTAEGNQAEAYSGWSVSTAGDVNGDGYSDVIIGADSYTNGEPKEGAAFVYHGNNGGGLSLRPQQRQADDDAPIAALGRSRDASGFRLAALGRTPMGRGPVALEWEVKPLGTFFTGSGLQRGAYVDAGLAGAELNELVAWLSADTAYHWRLRLKYSVASSPLMPHSRWLTLPDNGWQETDLRTPPVRPSSRRTSTTTATSTGLTTRPSSCAARGQPYL